MSTLYIRQKQKKINSRVKLLRMLFLPLMLLIGTATNCAAQRTNFSDWHVPPPLPPGNLTKGNTTGKQPKNSAIVLIPVDIPAPQLPKAPPVQLAQMAAISTTAPSVNTPAQPAINNSSPGSTDIPTPATPDAPSMPQQLLKDAIVITSADMPDPIPPEFPPVPAEPVPSITTKTKTNVPVMPGVIERASPLFLNEAGLNYWLTPAIGENTPVNITAPPASLNGKGIKTKKVKTKAPRN